MPDAETEDILRETLVIEQRLKNALSRHGSNPVLDDMQELLRYVFRLGQKLEEKNS